MRGLHSNQKKILDYLLEHKDGATLDQVAIFLGVTKSAAKEHLVKIDQLGYLNFIDAKGAIGRPRRRYLLSAEGREVFPKQYSWFSNLLLELLAEDLGEEAIFKLMNALADKVVGSLGDKFKNIKSSPELLKIITTTLNELGYRATLKQSDVRKGAVIEATNCVYHSVAQKHPELCRFDVRFLEKASGMNVKLESCIARGGSVCRFCLKPKR